MTFDDDELAEMQEAAARLTAIGDRLAAARLRPLRTDPHGPPYVCAQPWCQRPLTRAKLCWVCDAPEAIWWEGRVCCVATLTARGHRCGYVRLPDAHPWQGLDYDQPGPVLCEFDEQMLAIEAVEDFGAIPTLLAALAGGPDELAVTPAGQIRVHGGVTYAGPLRFVLGAPRGWWFGFDCNHAGDIPLLDHPALLTDRPYRDHQRRMRDEHGYRERSLEFVRFECKRMATAVAAGMREAISA